MRPRRSQFDAARPGRRRATATLALLAWLSACSDAIEPEASVVPDRPAEQGAGDARPAVGDGGLPEDAAAVADLSPPDGALAPDAAPPPPGCADDDQDGDGYGTGPACPLPDCDDQNAAIHPGAIEACDGGDDDCDGAIDEDLYTATCGVGGCAREVPNCEDGAPTRCTPGEPQPEACNGEDDDCDGSIDEDAGGATCGTGACVRPSVCGPDGPVCTPGEAADEVCNGQDDDCDGATDEGLQGAAVEVRSYTNDLRPRHAECDGGGGRIGPACNAAIHRHCAAQACRDTGYGPVENSGDTAVVTCLGVAATADVPFATLQGRHPGCAAGRPPQSPDCNAAINRWCQASGHLSGFGPLEVGPESMTVACVARDAAQPFEVSYAQGLAAQHPPCDGSTQRMGPDCNAAIHRWCRAQGFASGFGPVENSGDTAFVVCVRP